MTSGRGGGVGSLYLPLKKHLFVLPSMLIINFIHLSYLYFTISSYTLPLIPEYSTPTYSQVSKTII